MSEVIKVKRGLNIPLKGEAEKIVTESHPGFFAIKPIDFVGVFPKLLIQPGDEVKAGDPLFYDKYRDNIRFTAPVSGKVTEIRRGAKRVILQIIIEADKEINYKDFGTGDPNVLSRKDIIEKMLSAGVWPMIRQRPYSIIANPDDDPKAIFISAFDTSPLAPDYDMTVHSHGKEFQTGLDALAKLTSGKVHLNVDVTVSSKALTNSKNVQINYFSGPHPAGNVGTQIAMIDPVNKGDTIWYLRPHEVLTIGRLFLEGRLNTSLLVALTGSEVEHPRYYKTRLGASIETMVRNNVKADNVRYISGNPLTGRKIDKDGYVSFYDSQVTVLPEGDYYEFLGWAMPRLNKFSTSLSYFSWLTPRKKYSLDTNLNGGVRAYVMTGEFEKVFGWDIYPLQLIKAILIEDIDQMEMLGIYEVDEEDFALCEYVDTSKTEIQDLVRKGLNFMRKEMM